MRFFCRLSITALLPALIACGAAGSGQTPPQPAPASNTAAPAAQPAARTTPPCAGAPGDHAPALPQPTRTGEVQPCATPAPSSSAGAATPLQGQRAIGLPSQGQTVELEIGETFELQLTGAMAWTVNLADDTIVGQLPGQLAPGSQGVFKALAPGHTILTADGEPLCRSATPACMTPSYHFELALVVREAR